MMAGPKVTHVPGDRRPVHVLHGDVVVRLTVPEAQALRLRLGTCLETVNYVVGGMSDYQRRRLHALLREHGATGEDRFPVLSRILDRPVESTNDLSPGEADRCIAHLDATRPAPAHDGTEAF